MAKIFLGRLKHLSMPNAKKLFYRLLIMIVMTGQGCYKTLSSTIVVLIGTGKMLVMKISQCLVERMDMGIVERLIPHGYQQCCCMRTERLVLLTIG